MEIANLININDELSEDLEELREKHKRSPSPRFKQIDISSDSIVEKKDFRLKFDVKEADSR